MHSGPVRAETGAPTRTAGETAVAQEATRASAGAQRLRALIEQVRQGHQPTPFGDDGVAAAGAFPRPVRGARRSAPPWRTSGRRGGTAP